MAPGDKGEGAGFFQHTACPYFPCHDLPREGFNCLFCYCPLYALGADCGGSFRILPNGIKDCSRCGFPHVKENYPQVVEKVGQLCRRMAEETRKTQS